MEVMLSFRQSGRKITTLESSPRQAGKPFALSWHKAEGLCGLTIYRSESIMK